MDPARKREEEQDEGMKKKEGDMGILSFLGPDPQEISRALAKSEGRQRLAERSMVLSRFRSWFEALQTGATSCEGAVPRPAPAQANAFSDDPFERILGFASGVLETGDYTGAAWVRAARNTCALGPPAQEALVGSGIPKACAVLCASNARHAHDLSLLRAALGLACNMAAAAPEPVQPPGGGAADRARGDTRSRAARCVWRCFSTGEGALAGLLLGRALDAPEAVVDMAAELVRRCAPPLPWSRLGEAVGDLNRGGGKGEGGGGGGGGDGGGDDKDNGDDDDDDGEDGDERARVVLALTTFADRAAFDTVAGKGVGPATASLFRDAAERSWVEGAVTEQDGPFQNRTIRVAIVLGVLDDLYVDSAVDVSVRAGDGNDGDDRDSDKGLSGAVRAATAVLCDLAGTKESARALVEHCAAQKMAQEQQGGDHASGTPVDPGNTGNESAIRAAALEHALSLASRLRGQRARAELLASGALGAAVRVLVASAEWRLECYRASDAEARSAPQVSVDTGVPFLRHAVRLVGNAVHRHREAQDFVREQGGVHAVLSHTGYDEANPLIREWALFAVRNLCEGNEENQKAISELNLEGVANERELRESMRVDAKVVDGKVRVSRDPGGD